jgi:endogenous inhibitor of DNA gyrase (YacG/DUF329 family)
MVDLALIEITRDLDFKPNRFRECPRCGNFFYQPTEKKSIYCSIRCGNAVRMQQFRKQKKNIRERLESEEKSEKMIVVKISDIKKRMQRRKMRRKRP